MAYSSGPCPCLSKTCETLSWGPQDLETFLACDLGGTTRERSMAVSWMGIGFLDLETIPCLVPFPDQMQPTVEGVRERFSG